MSGSNCSNCRRRDEVIRLLTGLSPADLTLPMPPRPGQEAARDEQLKVGAELSKLEMSVKAQAAKVDMMRGETRSLLGAIQAVEARALTTLRLVNGLPAAILKTLESECVLLDLGNDPAPPKRRKARPAQKAKQKARRRK